MGSFRRVLVGVCAVAVAGGLLGIPTENASAAAAQPCDAAGYKLSLQSLTGPPRADLDHPHQREEGRVRATYDADRSSGHSPSLQEAAREEAHPQQRSRSRRDGHGQHRPRPAAPARARRRLVRATGRADWADQDAAEAGPGADAGVRRPFGGARPSVLRGGDRAEPDHGRRPRRDRHRRGGRWCPARDQAAEGWPTSTLCAAAPGHVDTARHDAADRDGHSCNPDRDDAQEQHPRIRRRDRRVQGAGVGDACAELRRLRRAVQPSRLRGHKSGGRGHGRQREGHGAEDARAASSVLADLLQQHGLHRSGPDAVVHPHGAARSEHRHHDQRHLAGRDAQRRQRDDPEVGGRPDRPRPQPRHHQPALADAPERAEPDANHDGAVRSSVPRARPATSRASADR